MNTPSGSNASRSKTFRSIDAYHAGFPEATQAKLETLRKTIRQIVPRTKEIISYNIPTFSLNKNLVHYAAYEKHIGFYPTSAPMKVFADQLKAYKTSKGAIQFPLDQPLPLSLIKQIVMFRMTQDAGQVNGKKKTIAYPDGSIKAQGQMQKNKLHGYWEWFRKNGTRLRSGYFFTTIPLANGKPST